MNVEGFQNYIADLPITNPPAVFGLHSNAEITYFNNSAKDLWHNLLLMQTGSTGGAS